MQDLRCKECGQSFKSPSELQDHTERLHGIGKKGGEPIVGNPPSERSR
ncbi:MAG: C2H2-type zinc finger protein [Chloroflexi bacterium]|nr:MAG: C2H2-type zinc finger protein [Chloroflexota bacterium]